MVRCVSLLIFAGLTALLSKPAPAQQMACGQAVSQLQSYAQQVNAAASQQYEYIRMQCGWNQQCQMMYLGQLNQWYQQQSQMVNNWYMQISSQCNRRQPPPLRNKQRRDEPPELDEDSIGQLDVDDEDKTVRIRIPSTPKGFR